ncbi:MAG: ATP-binding protein [Oscillospiraceae bacterium]|nr:ATP-binding protein [Oscillospiraceae bacterium]
MKELSIDAEIKNTRLATEFVDELLEEHNCNLKAQTQIDIAIDEIFSNIARYAYAPDTGTVRIVAEITENPKSVKITLIDSGVPYNPLEATEPDITLSAEEREIGGLGIYMVRKTMDNIIYEYKDGQNILSIVKNI